jgi:hypothetical protein
MMQWRDLDQRFVWVVITGVSDEKIIVLKAASGA